MSYYGKLYHEPTLYRDDRGRLRWFWLLLVAVATYAAFCVLLSAFTFGMIAAGKTGSEFVWYVHWPIWFMKTIGSLI